MPEEHGSVIHSNDLLRLRLSLSVFLLAVPIESRGGGNAERGGEKQKANLNSVVTGRQDQF